MNWLKNLVLNKQSLKLASVSILTGWVLGVGSLFIPMWNAIDMKIYDEFTVYTAPLKSRLPITIVGIDEASLSNLGIRWPWPRDMHARLVDRLRQSGAAVIGFDVVFAEPSPDKNDDAEFSRAISAFKNLILASDTFYSETANTRRWDHVEPLKEFKQAGAIEGLIAMPIDGDSEARRMSNADDAMWRVAIQALNHNRPGKVVEPFVPENAMIRHLGPSHTFPYVPYYQVLNGDPAIPANFFTDHIVLVGLDVRSSPEIKLVDTFATPFMHTSGLLTPGVEIHATQIENALTGQFILPASRLHNIIATTLVLILLVPILLWWHPLRSTLLALLLGCAALGFSIWAFASYNVWLATATPLLAITVAFLTASTGSYFTERRRATEIRSAFSKYVSSEVVNEMINSPERLKLGGRRREITILFCDLAGFTSMSEKLTPDQVAHVINIYLNAMTRIIMSHGGTVDKFIGDAIMAFWGDPLDDQDHGLNAVKAAIEMQDVIQEMQTQFHALGIDKIALRIGINSGPAIVGNMGSDLRFDYTAMGDSVNLAARLEGVNKAYGTKILLSESTAKLLNNRILLRPVDRVRVKGKALPVNVFTPCKDAVLVAKTQLAWEAYLASNWQLASEYWNEIRKFTPHDSLIEGFEARIQEYIATPPPADWDGSIALEKL